MAEIRNDDIPEELFAPVDMDKASQEHIARAHSSAMHDGWVRLRKNKAAVLCFVIIVLIALMAIFAPVFSHYAYYETNYKAKLQAPSWEHPFGTDLFGRDQWVRIWYGTRISLLIGLAAALINLVIGVFYGAISAIMGGRVDAVMQRIIEVLVGIPNLIIVILFMMVLPSGVGTIILSLCITGWVNMARLVRAQILKLKNQEFVLAARLLGTSTRKIITKHLIPNTISVIVIQVMFAIPSAIFTEAFLSFVGIGITAPESSWGLLANECRSLVFTYPVQIIWPIAAICLTVLSLNFIGDGIGEAFSLKK